MTQLDPSTSSAHSVSADTEAAQSVQSAEAVMPAGVAYWRSLEEMADTPEFREAMSSEFATGYDPAEIQNMSRRRFMKVMAASMALAGIGLTGTGCRRWPKEEMAPYANRPENTMPGEPEFYASFVERGGISTGIVVTSFDGRPVKLEGNVLHPGSLGASDAMTQASLLEMYDPDRARGVAKAGAGEGAERMATTSDWGAFAAELENNILPLQSSNAGSLAVLCEATSSPTVARLKTEFLRKYRGATWATYDPVNRDHQVAGMRMVFGKSARPVYHLENAHVIAAFDDDLINTSPNAIANARGWAAGRKGFVEDESGWGVDGSGIEDEKGKPKAGAKMTRLYVVESAFSQTGSVADHRLPVKASTVPTLLSALAAKLGVSGAGFSGSLNGSTTFIESLAKDLKSAKSHGVVTVGIDQPAEAHALAYAINKHLKALGTTVDYVEATIDDQQYGRDGFAGQLASLVGKMNRGEISRLIILGGNPVYDAPADLGFAAALSNVTWKAHLSVYRNATSVACDWMLPKAHFLESWGDGYGWDGTPSIQQPLIMPLFSGRTPAEVVSMLVDETPTAGYDLVRETWGLGQGNGTVVGVTTSDEKSWRTVLHDGLAKGVKSSVLPSQPYAIKLPGPAPVIDSKAGQYEIIFKADPKVYDGRYINNGWLQELPEPLTKLTWDNAALVNIADCEALGVSNGQMIEVIIDGKTIKLPVYQMPGQARGSITLWLGYGQEIAGNVGRGIGFNVYPVRMQNHLYTNIAKVSKAPGRHTLALTNNHYLMEPAGMKMLEKRGGKPLGAGKDSSGYLIKDATLDYYQDNEKFVNYMDHGDLSLQLFNGAPDFNTGRHQWGMAIDMASCTGCSACVVACQAENNIPVVGKENVLQSREMHWIRIDRYFKTWRSEYKDKKTGELKFNDDQHAENPEIVYQPVACVHCENAPCEQVCPVAATVHDTEGLNTMVYNRCIGTRYCSNNCPYKVRRFNYFDYHSKDPRGVALPWLGIPDAQQEAQVDKIKRMMFNPEVTVRMRGIMEKCTYCTQRIMAAKVKARYEYEMKLPSTAPGAAKNAKRDVEKVQDGEVVTACQQSCPTNAIVFGDLSDPNSRVSKVQKRARSYELLAELNTRPRTHYLAKISNPDMKLLKAKDGGSYTEKSETDKAEGDHADHASLESKPNFSPSPSSMAQAVHSMLNS